MSDKRKLLNDIKSLFFSSETESELKFIDAKSGDLILRVEAEDFTEGLKLLIVTPDGAVEAEDGTYKLEDGRELYVVGGIIDRVEMVEETPEAEVEVETPEAEVELSEVELEAVVEAAPYVDETGEIKKEPVNVDELMERLIKCEAMINEMVKSNEEMSKFSKAVEDKIETFIKDTPAELEFKSIKSEFNSMNESKKTSEASNLEAIRQMRNKNK